MSADYTSAGRQYLSIGNKVFDLEAEDVITTFRKGLVFRSFSITRGIHQVSLKYWPPFHWTTFDGELYRYYDLFWIAHITNRKLPPL